MNYNVYVAGGWFSESQSKAVREIETILGDSMIEFYSPRLDALWEPGMDSNLIVSENMDAIDNSSFMIASTEGKDMGTLFECGYAFARGVPVIYYFKGEGNFNIMLASTGICTCQSYEDLAKYIDMVKHKGLINIPYVGDME